MGRAAVLAHVEGHDVIRQGFYTRRDGIAQIDKVPGEVTDYTLDWAHELKNGQAIAAASFTVPAGITMISEGRTGREAVVRLSGGSVGNQYNIDCAITKTNGEQVVRSFVVNMVQDIS